MAFNIDTSSIVKKDSITSFNKTSSEKKGPYNTTVSWIGGSNNDSKTSTYKSLSELTSSDLEEYSNLSNDEIDLLANYILTTDVSLYDPISSSTTTDAILNAGLSDDITNLYKLDPSTLMTASADPEAYALLFDAIDAYLGDSKLMSGNDIFLDCYPDSLKQFINQEENTASIKDLYKDDPEGYNELIKQIIKKLAINNQIKANDAELEVYEELLDNINKAIDGCYTEGPKGGRIVAPGAKDKLAKLQEDQSKTIAAINELKAYNKQLNNSKDLINYENISSSSEYQEFTANYSCDYQGLDWTAFGTSANSGRPQSYKGSIDGKNYSGATGNFLEALDPFAIVENDSVLAEKSVDVEWLFTGLKIEFSEYYNFYSVMTQEEIMMYHYLFVNEGRVAADNYLELMRETLNFRLASLEAFEFIEELDLNNEGDLNKNLANLFGVSVEGLEDGIDQFFQGLDPDVRGSDKYTALDYKKMIVLYYLQEHSNYYDDVYSVSLSIGNMVFPMLVSAIVSLAATPAAGALVGLGAKAVAAIPKIAAGVTMYASVSGNAQHDALIGGASMSDARWYGILSGASEVTLGFFLGRIPFLSNNSGSFVKDILGEALEEGLQVPADGWIRELVLDEHVDWNKVPDEMLYSACLGAITSGIMNGPTTIATVTVAGKNVAITLADLESYMNDNPGLSSIQAFKELHAQKTGKSSKVESIDSAKVDNKTSNNNTDYVFVGNNKTDVDSTIDWSINAENSTSNINTTPVFENSNIEVIDVKTLKSNRVSKARVFDVNQTYEGYDFVIKPNGNLSEVINSLNTDSKVLIEVESLSDIDASIVNSIPDNVEVRIIGGYTTDYMNGLKSPNGTQTRQAATYTNVELQQIMEQVKLFEQGIDPHWSALQKAKYAYDYLKSNITYVAEPGSTNKRGKQFDGLMSLVAGESTCVGFAYTYKELLNLMGIDCEVIGGQIKGERQHGYNVVTIDGKTFLVDTVREMLKNTNGTTGFGVVSYQDYIPRNANAHLQDGINATNEDIVSSLEVGENIESNKTQDVEQIIGNFKYDSESDIEVVSFVVSTLKDAIANGDPNAQNILDFLSSQNIKFSSNASISQWLSSTNTLYITQDIINNGNSATVFHEISHMLFDKILGNTQYNAFTGIELWNNLIKDAQEYATNNSNGALQTNGEMFKALSQYVTEMAKSKLPSEDEFISAKVNDYKNGKISEELLKNNITAENVNTISDAILEDFAGKEYDLAVNEIKYSFTEYESTMAISDLTDAIFKGNKTDLNGNVFALLAVHGSEYYSNNGASPHEIVANFFQIKLTGTEADLNLIKNTFGPDFYNTLDMLYNYVMEQISTVETENVETLDDLLNATNLSEEIEIPKLKADDVVTNADAENNLLTATNEQFSAVLDNVDQTSGTEFIDNLNVEQFMEVLSKVPKDKYVEFSSILSQDAVLNNIDKVDKNSFDKLMDIVLSNPYSTLLLSQNEDFLNTFALRSSDVALEEIFASGSAFALKLFDKVDSDKLNNILNNITDKNCFDYIFKYYHNNETTIGEIEAISIYNSLKNAGFATEEVNSYFAWLADEYVYNLDVKFDTKVENNNGVYNIRRADGSSFNLKNINTNILSNGQEIYIYEYSWESTNGNEISRVIYSDFDINFMLDNGTDIDQLVNEFLSKDYITESITERFGYLGSISKINGNLVKFINEENVSYIINETANQYYNFFMNYHDLNAGNTFGVDQHGTAKMAQINPQAFKELCLKFVSKGLSYKDAVRLLKQLDSKGACSYASLCNTIFAFYKDNPQAFKNDFGFDMFVYNSEYNYYSLNTTELLADLYLYVNNQTNNPLATLFKGKDKIKIVDKKSGSINTKNQQYMSTSSGANISLINNYLKSKNSNLTFSSTTQEIGYNSDSLSDSDMKVVRKNISDAITSGKTVGLGIYTHYTDNSGNKVKKGNVRFITEDNLVYVDTNSWSEGAGHAVFVSAVVENGVWVSSWGKKLFIPFSDLQDARFSVLINSIEGIETN